MSELDDQLKALLKRAEFYNLMVLLVVIITAISVVVSFGIASDAGSDELAFIGLLAILPMWISIRIMRDIQSLIIQQVDIIDVIRALKDRVIKDAQTNQQGEN